MPEVVPTRDRVILQPGSSVRPGVPMSPLAFATMLLRSVRTLIACAFVLASVGLLVGLLSKRTYTATASFMPQSQHQLSQLSGLAAQFGLAVPNGESGFSAAVYADLLASDDMLGKIVVQKYPTVKGDSITLVKLLRVSEDTPALQRARAIRALGKQLRSSTNARTGVVNLSVTLVDPVVDKAVLERLIASVVTFNLNARQSQASAERRFTEQRLNESRDTLNAAEDALRTFLRQNRGESRSPDLMMEQDRLQRRVTMMQQVYTTLAQAFEQAKIEEVRDTPVITVLQPPEQPAIPDSRRTVVKAALGAAMGLFLGVLIVLLRETIKRRKLAGEPDAEDLSILWQDVRGALRLRRTPNPAAR